MIKRKSNRSEAVCIYIFIDKNEQSLCLCKVLSGAKVLECHHCPPPTKDKYSISKTQEVDVSYKCNFKAQCEFLTEFVNPPRFPVLNMSFF